MKNSIFVCVMLLASCASGRPDYFLRSQATVYPKNHYPHQFKNESGRPGAEIGVLSYKKGEPISTYAYYFDGNSRGGRSKSGYLIMYGKDSVWVSEEEVVSECIYNAEQQNADFFVPDSVDKKYWARANYYVSSNADMKIQTANEYLIDTYNATSAGRAAYTISKEPKDNGFMYHVKCRYSEYNVWTGVSSSTSAADSYARRCAYYIVTGKCK